LCAREREREREREGGREGEREREREREAHLVVEDLAGKSSDCCSVETMKPEPASGVILIFVLACFGNGYGGQYASVIISPLSRCSSKPKVQNHGRYRN
jgi:hypothetical protein